MKYLLSNLIIPVENQQDLQSTASRQLGLPASSFNVSSIFRKALDTRKKNHPQFVYTLELSSREPLPKRTNLTIKQEHYPEKTNHHKLADTRPIIVGMGPSGLFCALAMVEQGLKPIVFDRGSKLDKRNMSVNEFWQKGILDPESNVQFGEGGAGAFSDGKLTSRNQNPNYQKVFDYLVRFGAPEQIRYEALPHLGTDGIRTIVANIRDYLYQNGCEFHYDNKLTGIKVNNGKVTSVSINGITYNPEVVILAVGNAARDIFRLLDSLHLAIEPKPYAVGMRIVHPQSWINEVVYGNNNWAEKLGAASYRLTSSSSGRGVYTFCMCPGGYVISASTANHGMVTNGMSYSARNAAFGNSGIVAAVTFHDYGQGILDGVAFQEHIESAAFMPGYAMPYQSATDFIKEQLTQTYPSIESLSPLISHKLNDLFPHQIINSIKHALKHFDNIYPGFISKGILIAPETRTSSPVRIIRDEISLNCSGISNLYPVGEGAGYAGGIISSAADGFRTGSMFIS